MDELLNRVLEILKGIDEQENDVDGGWWETSVGAEFGANKIELIKKAFEDFKT